MANNPLTIAALPLNIIQATPATNVEAVRQALASIKPETDILALPELFSTGFISDPEQIQTLAEHDNGFTLTRLREFAAYYRIAICGSFLACNPERTHFFNRAFFIEPNGETTYCNKRHLFGLSPEAKLMTPGNSDYRTVRFRGWSIGFGVCYDLRFPVWCRNRMVHGSPAYDAFIFFSNWPAIRGYALETLLRARAIENQAYMICANRSGADDYGEYNGQSYMADFQGKIVSQSETSEPIYITTDRNALEMSRKKLTALLDADSFEIKY